MEALSRYRPRVLTLLLLTVISALLVLANLSDELGHRFLPTSVPQDTADWTFDVQDHSSDDPSVSAGWTLSYGWPLLWRQYVILFGSDGRDVHECQSVCRLAANALMWLAMLAAPAMVSERLLRHYRPRVRWSLRTMLVAVALAAVCCGWFVAARDRANIEDPLIAELENGCGQLWVERWGPDWLELLGVDRLRKHVASADIIQDHESDEHIDEILKRLAHLQGLQELLANVHRLTPGMVDAIREMRQLRTLQIVLRETEEPLPGVAEAFGNALADKAQLRALSIDLNDSRNDSAPELVSHEFLTAIGKLTRLEALSVKHSSGDRLDYLAGLTRLKSLALNVAESSAGDPISRPPLLSRLPALPNLEAFDLQSSDVADGELRYLARFPRLKSLDLTSLNISATGLVDLASLESLEELAIDSDMLSAAGLESLLALKHLRALHVDCRLFGFGSSGLGALKGDQSRAVKALRSKPGLIVDADNDASIRPLFDILPSQYEPLDRGRIADARRILRQWKEEQADSKSASK